MWRISIIVAISLAATFLNSWFSISEGELNRKPLTDFPEVIGDWRMISDQLIDENLMKVLLVDDYVMRGYKNRLGEVIYLYIGYFKNQREGKQVHSPRQCLPGAGWDRVRHSELRVSFRGYKPSEGKVNVDIMGKGDARELYLWWYQGRGRIYASEYWNKAYLIWDAITKRRTDGALVRVNSKIGGDLKDSLSTQQEFIKSFLVELSQFIPQ